MDSYHIIHVKDDRFIGHGLNLSWKGRRPSTPLHLVYGPPHPSKVTGPAGGQLWPLAGVCWSWSWSWRDGGCSFLPPPTTAWSSAEVAGKASKTRKNVPKQTRRSHRETVSRGEVRTAWIPAGQCSSGQGLAPQNICFKGEII